MDGADATCRICRVYVHITGLGLDLMREELACCVPGLSDLCYFLRRPTLVRKGRSGLFLMHLVEWVLDLAIEI